MANRGGIPQPFFSPPERNPVRTEVSPVSPEQIASAQAVENHLHELADEILLSAGADGVAIALLNQGELRCRAVSGVAPPRGTRIDARSGLTGACLTTATLLRCDDTEQDLRVDREVCRALGIRAVVSVPVSAGQEVVGIFEVFSSRPGAFVNIDVDGLRLIAEEIANCFAAEEALSRAAVAAAADLGAAGELPSAWPPSTSIPRRFLHPASVRKWRTALGALLLALGLFLLLRAIRGPRAPMVAPAPTDSTQLSAAVAEPASVSGRTRQQAAPEPAARPQSSNAKRAPSPHRAPIAVASSTSPHPDLAPPPLMTGASSGNDALRQFVTSLPSAQPALPAGLRTSGGVPQPVLLRRVAPIYPSLARQVRIEGTVVLDALVGKDGKVTSVHVVSGNSLLAAAALRAVRQWRYQPHEINGEPVAVPVKITMNFQLGR
jgi:TonB family protein